MEIKRFFADNQVDYILKDIRKDATARKELVRDYKSRSVPTTVIDGEVIIGFVESKLREVLGL